MRPARWLPAVALLAGCATDLGGDRRDGGGIDAPAAAPEDAEVPPIDAPRDARVRLDSGPIPFDDTGVPGPVDSGGGSCTPTHTTCRGELECGMVPNGCPGGYTDCGECGGGELWCKVLEAPRWRSRIWPCVTSVRDAHPEYWDTDCGGGSVHILDARAAEYVRDVAACVMATGGVVAIVDPNAPMHEIRVRGTDDDVADNYPIRTYSMGCTRGGYTSSCTPSFF
jgi:hypothetical protein